MSKREAAALRRPRNQVEIAVDLARIGDLEATELRALWSAWFDRQAPGRMRRATLSSALAYRIQLTVLGGLSKASTKMLDAVAANEFGEVTTSANQPLRRIKPGTKLVREWHGVVHEVTVVEGGFECNGAKHQSLSAIARIITGTRWNGLVFFGLKSIKKAKPVMGVTRSTVGVPDNV